MTGRHRNPDRRLAVGPHPLAADVTLDVEGAGGQSSFSATSLQMRLNGRPALEVEAGL